MRARRFALGFAVLGLLTTPAAADAVRVAVVPVVVHSSEAGSDYLSQGLADMLSARLERSGDVTVVRTADGKPSASLSAALKAGRGAGADFVLFGSFTQFGAGASLDLHCAQVAGAEDSDGAGPRRIFIQAGTVGEIIPKLEGLADKVTRYVTGTEGPAPSPPQGAVDADHYDELMRRVEALERAVYVEAAEPAPDASEPGEAAAESSPGAVDPAASGSSLR